mgnify:CR=1 FL=1
MNFDPDLLFRLVDVTGVFTNAVLGGAVARTKGFDAIGFVVLAISSGLGGGMLRDVLCNQVPVVLRRELYASVSLVVCILFIGLREQNRQEGSGVQPGAVAVGQREAAWRRRLPWLSRCSVQLVQVDRPGHRTEGAL